MRKFYIHRQAQEEFYIMGLSERKTALCDQTCMYRRPENSSSTGEKGKIYALGKLGGTQIGLSIVTQILLREI